MSVTLSELVSFFITLHPRKVLPVVIRLISDVCRSCEAQQHTWNRFKHFGKRYCVAYCGLTKVFLWVTWTTIKKLIFFIKWISSLQSFCILLLLKYFLPHLSPLFHLLLFIFFSILSFFLYSTILLFFLICPSPSVSSLSLPFSQFVREHNFWSLQWSFFQQAVLSNSNDNYYNFRTTAHIPGT